MSTENFAAAAVILMVGAVLFLSGCATTAGIGGATFCQVAKPIYWTAADTRNTKEQADTHNRVGKELCGWGAKK